MKWVDVVVATLCFALGIRSAVHWLRRPLDSTAPADHALFALFLVARVGTWVLLAAWFAGLATVAARVENETLTDRSVPDEIRARYGWLVVAFFAATGIAFLASYFLARRASTRSVDDETGAGPPSGS